MNFISLFKTLVHQDDSIPVIGNQSLNLLSF